MLVPLAVQKQSHVCKCLSEKVRGNASSCCKRLIPHEPRTFLVVAINIKTGDRRILDRDKTERDAEAIVKMAIMRRGVDVEFYKVEKQGV